jgi:hypothetical protein
MDASNPAVEVHTRLTPADLQRAVDDPVFFRNRAKKMTLIQLDKLHRIFSSPDIPVGQRMAFAEFLVKLADLGPKPAAQMPFEGARFGVNIVLDGSGQQSKLASVEIVQSIEPPIVPAAVLPVTDV